MSGTDYTLTTNYGLYKPIQNADINGWGGHLNTNSDTLDGLLYNGLGGSRFNVRDHGVKMDGVTDDFAALQALVTGPGAVTGAVIYFPPSAHSLLLSQAVTPQSNQTWWAYPGSVTIAPTAGNAVSPMLVSTASTSNVIIYGLTFDGGGQDFSNGGLVTQAYHVNGLTLDHVTFQNTRGMAVNGSGVNDLVVRECRFINCGNHWKTTNVWADAVQALTNGSGDGVTWGFRTRVEHCTFSECGGDNINLGAIQGVQIISNTFTNTSKPYMTETWPAYFSAVFPLFCTDVVISGNVINGLSGNAIDAAATWEGVISGNTILNIGAAGVGLFDGSGYSSYGAARGSRNVAITGNVIENCGQWSSSPFRDGVTIAVTAVAGIGIRITNNIITDTQTTKTQQHAVSYTGPPAWSGVWVDPSNRMSGNVVGALSGLPLAGLAMDDSGNLSAAMGVGMWNAIPPASKPVVTGAKGSNAALASLLSALASYGLITDSSTA